MPTRNMVSIKQGKGNLNLRGGLLIMQILLPFGLHFALGWESQWAAVLIATVYLLSMGFLIWLG